MAGRTTVDRADARDKVVGAVLRWDTGWSGTRYFDDYSVTKAVDADDSGLAAYVNKHPEDALRCGCPGVVLSVLSATIVPWEAVDILGDALGNTHFYDALNTEEGKRKLAAKIKRRWKRVERLVVEHGGFVPVEVEGKGEVGNR